MTRDQSTSAEAANDGASEKDAALRARALSSPVRWQILRLCLESSRTNKELADLLDINPGSMLHHVRTLVAAGYLEAQEPRRGARNSLEIPYVTTPMTWTTAMGTSPLNRAVNELFERTSPEAEGPDAYQTGMVLDASLRAEFLARASELVEEFRTKGEALGKAAGPRWSGVVLSMPDASGRADR